MKVLWIAFEGTWIRPTLDSVKNELRAGWIVPSVGAAENRTAEENDVRVYRIAVTQRECIGEMSRATFRKYEEAIRDFGPDLIHVHGTEKNLGQVQRFLPQIPVVVSIQGLLAGCEPYAYNYLDRSAVMRFRTIKNLLRRGGVGSLERSIRQGLAQEAELLREGRYFVGRTAWDRAHVRFVNPAAEYFRGEELLRAEFYAARATWDAGQCRRHSIFMPSGLNPIKGAHLAIEAVRMLRQFYPDVLLSIPGIPEAPRKKNRIADFLFGEEYIRYLRHLIGKYGLEQHVVFLPKLDAAQMVEQMLRANVFLSPSSIDNSPNAVGEATMVGTPVVTTPVGGVPSILQDGHSALFAPAGDPYMMAYQIGQIFHDDALAKALGTAAYAVALRRHDPLQTGKQYAAIYEKILAEKS